VKVNIYLTNIADRAIINEYRIKYFGEHRLDTGRGLGASRAELEGRDRGDGLLITVIGEHLGPLPSCRLGVLARRLAITALAESH
jgi:hypothetical protein